MGPQTELEQLLANLLDGPPDPANHKRLGELLREHPDLQKDYLDYLQLHALLRWRAGTVMPSDQRPVPEETSPSVLRRSRRWFTRPRLAAAVLFLAVGLGGLMLYLAPHASAAPDVVERLINLHLDILQAHSPDERSRIYLGQVADLKATLASSKLPPEDHALATTLLENSSWLTGNDDPQAEADRCNDIADMLVIRMDAASAARDERRLAHLADTYQRLTELGVDANLDRALASNALNHSQRKQKLDHALRCDANRAKKLAEIIERHPEPSRKAIRRAMKTRLHKSLKHHKSG